MPEWIGDRVESDAPKSDSAAKESDSPADASTLFGFLSNKYLNKKPKDDQPILAIDPNKPKKAEKVAEIAKPEKVEEETIPTKTEEPTPLPVAEQTATGTPPPTETLPVSKDTKSASPSELKPAAKVAVAPPPIPKPKPLRAKNPEHEAQAEAGRSEYNVALAEMKSGNLEGALSIFKTLSAQYPLLSGPVVNQGIILRKQGKLKEAKKVLQDALFNKYQNPYLLSELGAINRDLGNFKQAKQAYLSAIRIEEAYANAHYNLGVLADLYLHDPELALKEFKAYQALQEKPNKKVKGWIKELTRRVKRMKKTTS